MKRFFIVLIFFYLNGFSFDKNGHKKIELKAYELLKAPAQDVPSGKAILEYLKTEGILKNDELPHSQFPDFSLDRQFEQNRQMYHFMANNSNVRKAAMLSDATSQKEYLLLSSLPDNLKLMYFLFRESVENCPEGPGQSGRGIYVLMHIVADSYSPEHTIREVGSDHLVTIKGWRFTGLFWPAEATKPDGNTLRLLHNTIFKARGDEMWGNKDSLSDIGVAAAKAIKELLIITYRAIKNPEQSDELIVEYLKKYFTPVNCHVNSESFEIAGTQIQISFKNEYDNITNREQVFFDYDRSPQIFIVIQGQFNARATNTLTSYGILFGHYVAPANADAAPFFLFRMPWGWSFSLNQYLNTDKNNFTENLRSKFFFFISAALPYINATLEPKIGAAVSPFNLQKHFTINPGFDLVWNVGHDFYPILLNKNFNFVRAASKLRISFGYEYESVNRDLKLGMLNPHNFNLTIGFNTFQTRMPHKTCR